MATSKHPGQPLVKADAQLSELNGVTEQTQAGSTVSIKYASTESNAEKPDIGSSPQPGQYKRDYAESPETFHSATFEATAVWDKKAVLALDGGGIRGYSELLILKRLMQVIRHLETTASNGEAKSSYHPLLPPPRTSELPGDKIANGENEESTSAWLPYHYFDYMAGTSTGGLIAIMLGRLKMSIDDCISVYEQLGERIFGCPRWFHIRSPLFWARDKYNHKTLEKLIQELVLQRIPIDAPGRKNFAFDENRCRVMVLSFCKSDPAERPYIFRSYDHLYKLRALGLQVYDRNPGPAHQVEIWRVARATSAAPTYFKAPDIEGLEYCDGGFGANNPSHELLREIKALDNDAKNSTNVMLSIGTGQQTPLPYLAGKGFNRFSNFLVFATKSITSTEPVHQSVEETSRTEGHQFHYYRLNVDKGLETIGLDEWKTCGRFRLKLGRCIGRLRSKNFADSQDDDTEKGQDQPLGSSGHANMDRSPEAGIPKWLRPKNSTLENIREHTEAYLAGSDPTKWINDCASLLVNSRRQRAANNPYRWAKVCASICYQCTVTGCPRGAKKYAERSELRRHLTHKHKEKYSGRDEDAEALELFLDDCKIEYD